MTLIQAFIVSRVPLDEAGSSLGWGETNVENDRTRRCFALDPVGTGLVVGISIMMGSEDVECTEVCHLPSVEVVTGQVPIGYVTRVRSRLAERANASKRKPWPVDTIVPII